MPALLNRMCRAVMHCYPFSNGQGRIVDRTFMNRLRFDETTLAVRCAGGYTMEVLPNDHIGRQLYLTGQFDGAIVAVLKSFCTRGDERILDIGANVGSVSCALLHAFPHIRLVAVEPQPMIYAILSKNLAAIGGDRAKALNVAIADRDGVGTMTIPSGNSGCSHLIQTHDARPSEPIIEVQLINGERLADMSGLDRIDIVKIDVEGFEESVLRALASTIRLQRPRAILFEHGGELSAPDAPIRQIFDMCGYRLLGVTKSLRKHALVPLEILAARGERAHDYVAVPTALS